MVLANDFYTSALITNYFIKYLSVYNFTLVDPFLFSSLYIFLFWKVTVADLKGGKIAIITKWKQKKNK